MKRPPTRCGCASSARRTRAPPSRSATSPPSRRVLPALPRSSRPPTCQAPTPSASSRSCKRPAGARRRPRALSRRGGPRAGRHRERQSRLSRCRPADRLARPSRRSPASMPRSPPTRRRCTRHAPTTCSRAAACAAATWRPAMRAPRRPRRAHSRPPSSSTPISSPRPASRCPSVEATASRSTACTQAPYMDREEMARVLGVGPSARAHRARRPAAAASAASSTSRCSRCWRWRPGCTRRPVRMVYTRTGVDGLHHQAPPRRASVRKASADAEGRLTAFEMHGRLQHRRLCLVGADGRQPRAGACAGALQGAQRVATAPARSSPTSRPAAPSVASACPRPRSPTRR